MGQPTQAVVVLSNPRSEGRNILYDARLLVGSVPAQGAESTLFIDGYDTPCNSGANKSGLFRLSMLGCDGVLQGPR